MIMKAKLRCSFHKSLLNGFALAVGQLRRHRFASFKPGGCVAPQWARALMVGAACLGLLLMSVSCQTANGSGKVRTYTLRVLGETGLSFEGEWTVNGVKETAQGTIPAVFEVRSAELECSFRRLDPEGMILLRVTEGLKIWGETVASEPKTTVGATIRSDGATWFISY